MKKCSKCDKLQPLTEFYKAQSQRLRDGYHCWCRTCARASSKAWSFSERGIAVRKQKQRDRTLRLKYGVTEAWFLEQLKRQKGLCAICRNDARSGGEPLGVDHCHRTGTVRGLLCRRCNFGIGSFNDNPIWAHYAWQYLARFAHTLPPKTLQQQRCDEAAAEIAPKVST